MFSRVIFAAVAAALSIGCAEAAYVGSPPLLITESNGAGQTVGSVLSGVANPNIPMNVLATPAFPPPQPSIPGKNALFPDAIGQPTDIITDGVRAASITPPYLGAAPGHSSLIVSVSPNPALQCPYVQAISQTASAQVITNPGGKFIHLCGIFLLGAAQEGVSVSEGTGATCATNKTMLIGGSGGTAQVAANGGFAGWNDRITVPMQVRGDNVCVEQSSTGNISGNLTYGVYQ